MTFVWHAYPVNSPWLANGPDVPCCVPPMPCALHGGGTRPLDRRQSLGPVVRIACLEDWFTNYRLLIEFFLMKPASNCAGAASFAPGWQPSASTITNKLKADYGWASEDVSHIGVPKPNKLVGNAAPAALKIKVDRVLEIADEFAAELARIGSPHDTLVANGVAAARAQL